MRNLNGFKLVAVDIIKMRCHMRFGLLDGSEGTGRSAARLDIPGLSPSAHLGEPP